MEVDTQGDAFLYVFADPPAALAAAAAGQQALAAGPITLSTPSVARAGRNDKPFSDIVGSTDLTATFGDSEWQRLVAPTTRGFAESSNA